MNFGFHEIRGGRYYTYRLLSLIFPLLLTTFCSAQDGQSKELDSLLSLDSATMEIDRHIKQLEARQAWKQLGIDLHYLGKYYYNTELQKAIYYTKEATTARAKVGEEGLQDYQKSAFNLGIFYRRAEEYQNSTKAYEKVISSAPKSDLAAKSYTWIGNNYTRMGDLFKAFEYYEKAEAELTAKGFNKNLLQNYINASAAYSKTGNPKYEKRAIVELNKALELIDIQKLKPRYWQLYNIKSNLGHLYSVQKDTTQNFAIVSYTEALQIAQQQLDTFRIANSLNDLGVAHLDMGKFERAQHFLKEALEVSKSDLQQRRLHYNLAQSHLGLGQAHEAIKASDRAFMGLLNSATYDLQEPTLPTLSLEPNKWLYFDLLLHRARIRRAQYDASRKAAYAQSALDLYLLSDQLLDLIRFESVEEKSQLFWRQKGAQLYTQAVALCFELNDVDQAYFFMEKNKAVLLTEEIITKNLMDRVLPNSVKSEDLRRRKELAQLTSKRVYVADHLKDSIQDLLFAKKTEYIAFVDSLKKEFPNFHKARKSIDIIPIDQLNALPFVEFILDVDSEQPAGFGILATNDQKLLFKIEDVDSLKGRIAQVDKFLKRPFANTQEQQLFNHTANTLFRQLFPPAAQQLLGYHQKITIIPDGLLQSIPFEVLIPDAVTEDYFIETHEIGYAYSQSFVVHNSNLPRNASRQLLGFAPVDFKFPDLMRLKYSNREIQTLEQHLGGQIFTREKATKKKFIEESGKFRIVHLATHADANDSITPWIAFHDEKLSLHELYTLEHQASLVVLSACNTAAGKHQSGEGIMSLARGFFNTGARSVLSSLWSVDDAANTEIIDVFYDEIVKGSTTTQSLRTAKLDYLRKASLSEASPYYWASLILIGEHQSIPMESTKSIWLLWFVGGILLLIVCSPILKKIR